MTRFLPALLFLALLLATASADKKKKGMLKMDLSEDDEYQDTVLKDAKKQLDEETARAGPDFGTYKVSFTASSETKLT